MTSLSAAATNAPARERGRVSFVIPTRNSGQTIAACVRSAISQSGDVEVVVVDNHSEDGTSALAADAGADTLIVAGPERSAQRNLGWARSSGEFVAFIDSDMVLRPGLAADIVANFERSATHGALVLPERSFGVGYLARSRDLEKRAYLGDRRAEAARAFRASALDEVGGYDESVNAFEDYELPDRVERAGWTLGRTSVGVDHDEGRVQVRELFAKKRYYGRTLSSVRGPGGTEFDWARRGGRDWRRLLRAMATDPLHAPGMVALKAVDGTGLLAGHISGRRSGR